MKNIKVVVVHNYFQPFKDPTSILAALIRFFAKTHWNHAELLIEEEGQRYLVGAMFPKVRRIDFDTWYNLINREFLIMDFDSEKSPEAMIEEANAAVGRRYDRDSLFIFIPFYLAFKVWIGRKAKKAKSPYCFELVAQVAGWPDSHNATPNEVFKMLK